MKILYLTNGLPHYFNLVLSKLNSIPGLEVVVVIPKGPARHIGDGVFQSREGMAFRVVERKEYSAGRLFMSFEGLPALLFRERPDVVVLPDYLVRAFFLHPALSLARLIVGVKLVLKSIPFQMPDYATAVRQLSAAAPNDPSSRVKTKDTSAIEWLLRRAALEVRAYYFRKVDAHVNYVDAARELYSSYGVAPSRIFVTRNSPDTDAMARTEDALKKLADPPTRVARRFLHVGRLVSQKRVDLLLDAFFEVHQRLPQAELVIVGDGPERKNYEERAARLGITSAVNFAGPIYDPIELGRHFLSASAFVLPGLGGLSINEAMFYGLAIVCSTGDGTEKYLVREGQNGAFFRTGDKASLAEAMIGLISDPGALRSMGLRSREIIDREVNIHTVIDGYMKAFHHVCS